MQLSWRKVISCCIIVWVRVFIKVAKIKIVPQHQHSGVVGFSNIFVSVFEFEIKAIPVTAIIPTCWYLQPSKYSSKTNHKRSHIIVTREQGCKMASFFAEEPARSVDYDDAVHHQQYHYQPSNIHAAAQPATRTTLSQNTSHTTTVKLWSLRNKELKQLCKFCGFRLVHVQK